VTFRLVTIASFVLAGVGVRKILDRERDIEIVADVRSPVEAVPVAAETDVVLVDVAPEEPSVAAANRRLTQGHAGQRSSWSAAQTTARN
jgi:DNA-binding NarL/FixJ family response regulator